LDTRLGMSGRIGKGVRRRSARRIERRVKLRWKIAGLRRKKRSSGRRTALTGRARGKWVGQRRCQSQIGSDREGRTGVKMAGRS